MDSSRTLPADLNGPLLDEMLAAKALCAAVMRVADGIVQVDEQGLIVRFSPGAEALLGFSAESVIGSPFESLLHPTSRGARLPECDEPQTQTLVLGDSAGKPVSVSARTQLLRHSGCEDGWVMAFAPKARVEEIEQLKNELVSTVSHELKTPLAAIKAYASTLRQNPSLYQTRSEEFLSVVEQQADRLSRLVDDMLLVTRVDSGQMLRRRVEVALDTIVDEALREVQHDPVLHPLERHYADVPVSGDPERLRDILRNLLENAMRYSPEGGPVEIFAHYDDKQTVISVRDGGIGIAEADIPYIFDRFYRADSEHAATAGGSGLGLYIVHGLVRAHGGTIEVRSEPGRGTTFTLRLPRR